MRTPPRVRCLAALALVVLLACGGVGATDTSGGFDPSTWLQGADGLYEALTKVKDKPAAPPLVVYFYTDWCGYCRQFERELLGTTPVKHYLKDVLAVRINPEGGQREREIATYYGVSGYPSFFVHNNRTKTLSSIERMKVEGGQTVLQSPDEFIETLRNAGER